MKFKEGQRVVFTKICGGLSGETGIITKIVDENTARVMCDKDKRIITIDTNYKDILRVIEDNSNKVDEIIKEIENQYSEQLLKIQRYYDYKIVEREQEIYKIIKEKLSEKKIPMYTKGSRNPKRAVLWSEIKDILDK